MKKNKKVNSNGSSSSNVENSNYNIDNSSTSSNSAQKSAISTNDISRPSSVSHIQDVKNIKQKVQSSISCPPSDQSETRLYQSTTTAAEGDPNPRGDAPTKKQSQKAAESRPRSEIGPSKPSKSLQKRDFSAKVGSKGKSDSKLDSKVGAKSAVEPEVKSGSGKSDNGSFKPGKMNPYAFMRRSCTFVAESSFGLRKSGNRASFTPLTSGTSPLGSEYSKTQGTSVTDKTAKDRTNLRERERGKRKTEREKNKEDGKKGEKVKGGKLKQEQEKERESDQEDSDVESADVLGEIGSSYRQRVGSNRRLDRLVGGLRAWSSSEDVRQSFMGALGRTVSVITQKRVKNAFSRVDSNPSTKAPQPGACPNSQKRTQNAFSRTDSNPNTKVFHTGTFSSRPSGANVTASSRTTQLNARNPNLSQGAPKYGKSRVGTSKFTSGASKCASKGLDTPDCASKSASKCPSTFTCASCDGSSTRVKNESEQK